MNMKKYPITYKNKEYTVTMKHHYDGYYYYTVKIYEGKKKWYSSYLFKKDILSYIKYSHYKRPYKKIIEEVFYYFQKELDLQEQKEKELQEFKEWDGVIE